MSKRADKIFTVLNAMARWLFIIVLILLVLAGIGYGVLYFFMQGLRH